MDSVERSAIGYDYARFDRRTRVREAVEGNEARALHMPKAETRAAGIKLNPGQTAVFFTFMSILLIIVFSFASLSQVSRANEALAKQLNAAVKEGQMLSATLESRVKLDEIADAAVNRLGMVKPDARQITYIDLSGPEKVEYFGKAKWYDGISQYLSDMLAYFG